MLATIRYVREIDLLIFQQGTNGVMVSMIFSDLLIVGSNPSLAIFLYNDKKNVVRGKGSILSDVKQKPWDSRLDK